MQLSAPGRPLEPVRRATADPSGWQVLVRVLACGVCRTDLHIADGELPPLGRPVVPGHEVVGSVIAAGPESRFSPDTKVGIPWLGQACGACAYCAGGRENLCDRARFTGYHIDGGYADHALADSRYCFALPAGFGDAAAAPLLCAGLIGYRSLRMAGDARRVRLYGFGAAAHIVAQVARHEGREVYAFTRPDDAAARAFAMATGATWAGGSDTTPPRPLDAAILLAPVGALVPAALRVVVKGGTVVCAGIHMSDIPAFPYELLWGERRIVSVANLTRRDGEEFLALAPRVPVRTTVRTYALEAANEALASLREGRIEGAAVLLPCAEVSGERAHPADQGA